MPLPAAIARQAAEMPSPTLKRFFMIISKENLSSDQAVIAIGMIACRALLDHGHFAARVSDMGVQIAHADDIVDLLSLAEEVSLQILSQLSPDSDAPLLDHIKRREALVLFPGASESDDNSST